EQVLAERRSASGWVQNLMDRNPRELKREFFSHPNFAGAFWFDVKTHEFERWVSPSLDGALKAPDPRLVLAQLKANDTQSMQMGPVLVINRDLYSTVAEPLGRGHALAAFLHTPEIGKILQEESRWAYLHAFVYDSERNPIF